MSNPANSGTIIGRLTQDIRVMKNGDGSRKLLLTVAADDNFRSGSDQKAQTSFIQLERFVAAGASMGGWDKVHQGDLIALDFHVEAKPYVDTKGETQYPQKLVIDGFPSFLEPKSVTEKRAAERAVKAAEKARAAQPVVTAEVSAQERIAQLEAELAESRKPKAQAAEQYDTASPFGN